jgi:hypothetical protein
MNTLRVSGNENSNPQSINKIQYSKMKNCATLFRFFLMLMTAGLFSFQLAQAQKITYSDQTNKAGFTLNEQNRSGVSISYAVESFTLAPAEINGRGMSNIELPGFWLPNDEGAPNLPGGGKYIAIPQGAVLFSGSYRYAQNRTIISKSHRPPGFPWILTPARWYTRPEQIFTAVTISTLLHLLPFPNLQRYAAWMSL